MTTPSNEEIKTLAHQFPSDFNWGCATASYQIEGAWNEEGKGESIWDHFCHENPGRIKDKSNGDVACNSYHLLNEDVALLEDLGASHYRFSISWPRLLPQGTLKGGINKQGVAYYHKLLDALAAKGIQPMVTLYHWDFPQALQNTGGWLNPDSIQHFKDYANLCFQEYGSKVKLWITFNEPGVFIYNGWGNGVMAPGHKSASEVYQVGHNVLLSHATVYHLYNQEYKNKTGGQIGIVTDGAAYVPKTDNDKDAVERAFSFCSYGFFLHPILKNGDYSDIVKDSIKKRSDLESLKQSRLPEFSEEQKRYLKGTADFIGLNWYTSEVVEDFDYPLDAEPNFWTTDSRVKLSKNPAWPSSGSSWLKVHPEGIFLALSWINDQYGKIPIYITENGFSDNDGTIEDYRRIDYYYLHLNSIKRAMSTGVQVKGYFAWSLLDNFEWAMGYTEKFGLVQIDFNNPERKRTKKLSYEFYQNLLKNHKNQN